MTEEQTCVRCGGHRLESGEVHGIGRFGFHPENKRFLTLNTMGVPIHALMCADCGYLQLFGDPKVLHEIVKDRSSE